MGQVYRTRFCFAFLGVLALLATSDLRLDAQEPGRFLAAWSVTRTATFLRSSTWTQSRLTTGGLWPLCPLARRRRIRITLSTRLRRGTPCSPAGSRETERPDSISPIPLHPGFWGRLMSYRLWRRCGPGGCRWPCRPGECDTLHKPQAHVRCTRPDPPHDQADKSSEDAHVRSEEAIPCTCWSHRPSIYRMSAN